VILIYRTLLQLRTLSSFRISTAARVDRKMRGLRRVDLGQLAILLVRCAHYVSVIATTPPAAPAAA
jgi:hypothetical protein